MAKKILAIFFVSILLCSYIIPTTSAFADVVIGDNDSFAVTQLGVENGKKIATMEAILQLLESGVSEINFNDISDLDDYLEDFYDELTNVNYQDVSNEILAGAYNDVQELKQWIDDRGEYIGTYYKDYLNSADEGLSNIFNDFQLKLPKSQLVGTSLNGFRGLSRFNRTEPTPEPNPNINYASYLATINNRDINGFFWYMATDWIDSQYRNGWQGGETINYSWVLNPVNNNNLLMRNDLGTYYRTGQVVIPFAISDIYIISTGDNLYSLNFSGTPIRDLFRGVYNSLQTGGYFEVFKTGEFRAASGNNSYTVTDTVSFSYSNLTLEQIFINLTNKVRNVNIYVDGVPWSIVDSNTTVSPTIDIDGFIKLYGNDNPIQYEFPQGTQIDYNALYTTIYNAIRDNLPLDMQTINNNQVYYDSHDTVYSPVIYNYYGKDGDDENDWIDSILDYATIPDFNSVLGTVAVLDAPFVNGITIVNTGVTDVIPTDILLILGGFFVLVLFVCIINRMSE